jgi:hypothetical protein
MPHSIAATPSTIFKPCILLPHSYGTHPIQDHSRSRPCPHEVPRSCPAPHLMMMPHSIILTPTGATDKTPCGAAPYIVTATLPTLPDKNPCSTVTHSWLGVTVHVALLILLGTLSNCKHSTLSRVFPIRPKGVTNLLEDRSHPRNRLPTSRPGSCPADSFL